MKAREVLKSTMKEKGVSQRALAAEFNTSGQCINSKVNRERIATDDFCQYMSAMGYTVKCEDADGNVIIVDGK